MLRVQFESKIGNGIEAGPETVMRFPVFHFYGHFFGRSGGTSRLPWAAVWLSLACVAAQAQDSLYRFDHWTTDDGLPQNTVTSVVQTRDGYLWLTTFDGLARFDGVRFTVFDKSNTRGISTNRFANLYEAGNGALLIATEDAGLIVYRNGVFTSYTAADGLPSNQVLEFFPDFDGEPVIATPKGSVYLRDGKIVPAPPPYQNRELKLYLAPSGARVTIDAGGVTRVKDGRAIPYPIKLATNDVYAPVMPYEDSRGNLWIRQGPNLYLLRDGQIASFPEAPPLRPLCEDAEGGVWFGKPLLVQYSAHVLARFKDGRFTIFGEADGVLNASVRSIIRDREGSLWLATTRGLYRARKRLMTAHSTESGLASHEVYPLAQSRDGDVWVGTTRGLNRVRFKEGRFESSPPLLPGFIEALWEDARGRIWIGLAGGLRRYENGKLQDLAVPAAVYGVAADRAGQYWVASSQGLFQFDDDKIIAHYTTKDGLPSNDVKTIHQDRRGTLWFGTYGGLVEFRDGKFITYTTADGLAGKRVRAIYEDADGTLWVGTYDDGLSRLREGRFFNYRTEQGLHNNGVFQILEDRRGNFWIGCNKGIYRVSRHELNALAEGRIARARSVAFGKQDGMLNTECNGGRHAAGFVAQDGKLWFPTMGGVVVIDPEAASVNPLPPPVVIEAVTLERGLVDFSQGVTIAPGQRDLEIAYTGLSLHKPEQVQFRYKLEGLDTDWVEAGTRRVAYFPYLSPGSYTFRALAANSDGVWNTEGASLRIVVEPPFWRRWWFIALVSLGVAGTVWLIFRQRVARLRAAHAAQEQFSRQLLDSQEQERQRIAAELHDSLGQSLLIIKNRSFLALDSFDDPDAAREQVEEISDASAHAIEEVREIAYNLRPYKMERFGLTKTLQAMCQQAERTSGIRFDTALQNIDSLFPNEAELNLYRVVQESVNNILKHSRATVAKLTIERDEREVRMKIEDNGQGFNAAPQAAANEPRRGGFGLIGMAERVRLLGGVYTIDSAPERGTTITVKLTIPEQKRTEKCETEK
jgi:signal transduction histidine kinase/ligand-binding sensor domain-containing protein